MMSWSSAFRAENCSRAGDDGRAAGEDDRNLRERRLLERVVPVIADARVGHPQLVDALAERGIQLSDRRVRRADVAVERVGKPERRRRREADVVQRVDVVVADRELVVPGHVEVGPDEILVAVGRLDELTGRIRDPDRSCNGSAGCSAPGSPPPRCRSAVRCR